MGRNSSLKWRKGAYVLTGSRRFIVCQQKCPHTYSGSWANNCDRRLTVPSEPPANQSSQYESLHSIVLLQTNTDGT